MKGRPTKLNKATITKAKSYLESEYIQAGDIVPSVAGLAHYLGLSRSTLYEYKAQNAEFSDTLERLATSQERLLLNGGLTGNFNATITKLMLSNHGYSEKQAIDHTSNDNSMTPNIKVEFIDPVQASEFYRDFMQ